MFPSSFNSNANTANDNIGNTTSTNTDTNTNTNRNTVILDLRVSCDTFWKYQMNLKVDRNDFIESNDGVNMNDININSCFHDNGNKTPVFSRLERYMCDAMIAHIHEDLLLNGEEDKIQKLCEVSSKFHIHGHTTNSLLYCQSNAPHADHGGCIYICSHC
jgi:hypothetical protein